MSNDNEVALLDALAARVARINGAGDYKTDIGGRVPKQRIDFATLTDDMPLVGVVLHGGEFKDVGDAAHYFDQETALELVGCIRADDDGTDVLDLLLDMKRAAFDEADDCIRRCVTLTPDGWHVFLASEGEAFTQVSLYLVARWCDSSVEH
jgi:hypothetical protein